MIIIIIIIFIIIIINIAGTIDIAELSTAGHRQLVIVWFCLGPLCYVGWGEKRATWTWTRTEQHRA